MNLIQRAACGLLYSPFGALIPDKPYLRLLWRVRMGTHLNLDDPCGYNEKLQWIKLYDHNPLYTTLVDKAAVKDWVANRIGSKYIIQTYGVWDDVSSIDWDSLPSQYVIKCTHDSGSVYICRDKSEFDTVKVSKCLSEGLLNSTYARLREWPYKNVPRRVIAEQLLIDDASDDLPDYKFYCFDGRVRLIGIYTNRNRTGGTKGNYFDREFNALPFTWGYDPSPTPIERPSCLNQMIRIAETLSSGISEIRVDLYLCNGEIYFGEMTLFDGSGFAVFDKPEYDRLLGDWIDLPEVAND